ncbi:MAG: hypothetical protein ABIR62_16165 [Dokdonella sp.]|uniref:hypothetical protein n=1 Tax=Dokdonella sp. TaxID=2291710 RepID=UPI0032661388
MRKIFSIIAFAGVAALTLTACDKGADKPKVDVVEQKPTVLPMPTNAADTSAWKQYLVSVVSANLEGVRSNHPYMYFVPGGDDDKSKGDRENQLTNVKNVVARNVLPGNMLAFGGPNSSMTAQFVTDAFKEAQTGAFKDVFVLFVGTPADAEAVKTALAPSAATVRFVEAK